MISLIAHTDSSQARANKAVEFFDELDALVLYKFGSEPDSIFSVNTRHKTMFYQNLVMWMENHEKDVIWLPFHGPLEVCRERLRTLRKLFAPSVNDFSDVFVQQLRRYPRYHQKQIQSATQEIRNRGFDFRDATGYMQRQSSMDRAIEAVWLWSELSGQVSEAILLEQMLRESTRNAVTRAQEQSWPQSLISSTLRLLRLR